MSNAVLIAGAGYVGMRLAGLLAAQGRRVLALRRSAVSVPDGVELVRADLLDRSSLGVLSGSIGRVVYCAGPVSMDEEGYRAGYVEGQQRLIDHLSAPGDRPSRWIFVSSTGVYHQRDGEWVDETSPTRPTRFSGQILLEGEQVARGAAQTAVVLRLGGIYGPGRTWLIDRVRNGEARCREGHFTNRIHRDDAAGALAHLLGLDAPQPLYLGVDSRPSDECEVLRHLAEKLGVAGPECVADDSGAAPGRAGSKRCRNDRLVESGYRFRYPSYREGYAAVLGREGP